MTTPQQEPVQGSLTPSHRLTDIDLLAALIHELSQPLTVLIGEFELASMYRKEALEYQELVERSLAEMNRLSACVAMFRDLAPVPDWRRATAVSLNGLLKRLCDALTPAAQTGGCRIEFSSLRDVSVAAHSYRLQLLLSRLMRKALDCATPGSILRIGVEELTDHASVRVSISWQRQRPAESSPVMNGDTHDDYPALNPKDPDWVLARWVAESSGGKFRVVTSADATWRLALTLPMAQGQSGRLGG